jgi:hypothetical protein
MIRAPGLDWSSGEQNTVEYVLPMNDDNRYVGNRLCNRPLDVECDSSRDPHHGM